MIRVGFSIASLGAEWIGGANYYVNLLNAIRFSERVRPVILTASLPPDGLAATFPEFEIIPTALLDRSHLTLARRASEKLYGRAFVFERFLRDCDIDVLSHSGQLGPRSRFPTIGWIPDFQHVRLPAFFSAKERRDRDGIFRRLADHSTRLVLSSEDARRDLLAFRPQAARKARVLHFVPGFANATRASSRAALERYGIEGPYFYLPNQFWVHKNHVAAVNALRIARARGRRLSIVATGRTNDHRNPGHFARLMQHAADSGCGDDFKVLGLVPFDDVAALMRHCVALINPSLFEGWSTTVEEAKSLGKTIILSDIPVHREQNPEAGLFFDPRAPDQLAEHMIALLDSRVPDHEAARAERARASLPARVAAFAQSYEDIVVEAASAR